MQSVHLPCSGMAEIGKQPEPAGESKSWVTTELQKL